MRRFAAVLLGPLTEAFNRGFDSTRDWLPGEKFRARDSPPSSRRLVFAEPRRPRRCLARIVAVNRAASSSDRGFIGSRIWPVHGEAR